jgi:hypothetical protein
MKIGRDPAHDVERVEAARGAIGPEVKLFVDANGAYDRKQALEYARRFAEFEVTWFEEPVSSDDLHGLRLLRDRAPAGMDIAAGEYCYEVRCRALLLEKMGLQAQVLDSGCCRMAGSFGFEQHHYDVSMRVGELVLLPEVRRAAKDTLVVADGFSCRTQIAQATDRRALHLADLMDMAAVDGPHGPPGDYPEHKYVPDHSSARRLGRLGLAAGALLGAAAVTYAARRFYQG